MTFQLFDEEQQALAAQIARKMNGPVMVLGAGGFIGSHVSSELQQIRPDTIPVSRTVYGWRSRALGVKNEVCCDISKQESLTQLLRATRPRTIINCAAYGAYPLQLDLKRQLEVNVEAVSTIANWCSENNATLVHLGSSSEYGTNSAGPTEVESTNANSHYSITKLAGTHLLRFQSTKGLIGACLRLYSIYGPLEDPSRLMPTLIREGKSGRLPSFSPRSVTRDFVYVSDALIAIFMAAVRAQSQQTFEIFNIGTGIATSMAEVADTAKSLFEIATQPVFQEPMRSWDLSNWYANTSLAKGLLGWEYQIGLADGLTRMTKWYEQPNRDHLLMASDEQDKERQKEKISGVVACYRDEQAIPIMYERLRNSITQTGCDYEIIFVNDASPDNSLEVIREISSRDDNVIGICHSRNFGSQAAFISGLQVASGDYCCLLDGDLQDPPEIIQEMYRQIKEHSADVAYGRRDSRTASTLMSMAYKSFYRILRFLSPYSVPLDAGDFSLMSRRVVNDILGFRERDLFLRIQRAYVGRKQIPISYHRPDRMFGKSTNNWSKNFRWAVKGIISASSRPLSILGVGGIALFGLSSLAVVFQLTWRLWNPDSAPPGVVTVVVLIAMFGSLNLVAVSIVGEYVGRILDEVRQRPRFIRTSLIRFGKDQQFDSGS